MGGTYPDAVEGEISCASNGNSGTAFPDPPTPPYRRTCYNPSATTTLEDVAALHPVRCRPEFELGGAHIRRYI